TQLYTLSLHDALPISFHGTVAELVFICRQCRHADIRKIGKTSRSWKEYVTMAEPALDSLLQGFSHIDFRCQSQDSNRGFPCLCEDRKSTRLNSSHDQI